MSAVVKAPAEMTIYSVAQVRGELLEALNHGAEIRFDVSGTTEIDGAGMQLLVSISRSGTGGMRVVGVSDALRERLARLGLDMLFRDSAACGAPA